MYLEHFSLRKRPFAITPDPDFLIWSGVHQRVRDAVLGPAPVTVLLGEIGCGKSTLVHALQEKLVAESGFCVGVIACQLTTGTEALQQGLRGLEGPQADLSAETIQARLDARLRKARAEGQRVLLIVDEAQSMSVAAAQALFRLATGAGGHPACPLLLVGLPGLARLLEDPALDAVRPDLGPALRLGPLPAGDIAAYVSGRLKRAGHGTGALFTDTACAALHQRSKGVPRLINKACDLLLLTAAQEDRSEIDGAFVTEVLQDVDLSSGALSFLNPAPVAPTPAAAAPTPAAAAPTPAPARTPSPPPKAKPKGSQEIHVSATQGMRLERALIETVRAGAGPASGLRAAPVGQGASPRMRPPAVRQSPTQDRTQDPTQAGPLAAAQAVSTAAPDPDHLPPDAPPGKPRRVLWGGLLVAAVSGGLAVLYAMDLLPPPPAPSDPSGAARPLEADPIREVAMGAPGVPTPPPVPEALSRAVAEAESTLHALQMATATTEAELDAARAQLEAARSEASDVTAALGSAQDELAAARSARAQADAALADTRAQLDDRQARLDALRAEAEAAQAEIAARTAGDGISTDAFTAAQTVSNPGTDADDIAEDLPRLTPLRVEDGAAGALFLAALESPDPTGIAVNYARAALRGHGRAASFLAQLYETGDGLVFAPGTAARWYAVAEDPAVILDTTPQPDAIAPEAQAVALLAATVTGPLGEFVWQGVSPQFTLDLGDGTGQVIAFVDTPLTAVAVTLPEAAAAWRVRTSGGAMTEWRALERTPE